MHDHDPFRRAAADLFARVMSGLRDAPDTSVDQIGNMLRILEPGGRRITLDRHDSIEQVWMADGDATWHFQQAGDGHWRDTRGQAALLDILANALAAHDRPIDFG